MSEPKTEAKNAPKGHWGRWAHGRYWAPPVGLPTYYIRKRIVAPDGTPRRFDVNTRRHTLHEALAEVPRFMSNPLGYDPAGAALPAPPAPVHLDAVLAGEFLAYLAQKGDSLEWRRNVRQHLAWWSEKLTGLDLRRLPVTELEGALAGARSARQRTAVVKALYGWLRRSHKITTTEDPTLGQLYAPPARPAQDAVDKTISADDVAAVCKALDAEWLEGGRRGRRWSDLLRLLSGCGMHVREARRFAASGAIEPLPPGRQPHAGEAGVLAVPLHKSGAPFRVAVGAETLEVAKRVLEAGAFSEAVLYSVLRRLVKEKKAPKLLPGRFRHTVARYAVERGATIEQVAAYHKHKDKRTTQRYYATLAVPPKVPTPSC